MNHAIERTIEIELTPEEAGQWFARQTSDVQAAFFTAAAKEMDKICRAHGTYADMQWCHVGQVLAEDDPALAGRHAKGREMLDAIKVHTDAYLAVPTPRVRWQTVMDPRTRTNHLWEE